MDEVLRQRMRIVRDGAYPGGAVAYVMSRDMRLHDNAALVVAADYAREHDAPFMVLYHLAPGYLGGGYRQWDFKIHALKEIEKDFAERGIPFVVTVGEEIDALLKELKKHDVRSVITDMSPLRIAKSWVKAIAGAVRGPVYEVDAHNVVPVWAASDHLEFGAYTLRPKIHRQLQAFLTEPVSFRATNLAPVKDAAKIDWVVIERHAPKEMWPTAVTWAIPGERAAKRALADFFEHRLTGYAERRNDPTEDGQSNLSPYLHYGMLSAQRVAWEVRHAHAPFADKEAFLEELVVRRELSDNFCWYNAHYDSSKGFPAWAQGTLAAHEKDKREYLYSFTQFEKGETHDALWNAAQLQMVKTGKMHGYMRMYWAKKIFEWTKDVDDAMRFAIRLNDVYELDGRDPNGYVGIAWSMGGVHDRAWGERAVFGKIRYMNAKGCARKFDVKQYIETWTDAQQQTKFI